MSITVKQPEINLREQINYLMNHQHEKEIKEIIDVYANRSNLAVSGLRTGTLSLVSEVLTKVQVNKTYTGNGSTQSITTNIASEDINWVTGTAYVIGDIRFTRAGTGVTAGAFTLWECNTDHTAGAVGLGTDTLGDSVWTVVADDTVKLHNSSRVWIKNRDATNSHVIVDTSRGVGEIVSSDTTAAEATDADTITAFTTTGFSLGADVKVNTNTNNFVAWQEAYHKIMITTTNQSKRALIAFDDVNNRSMILYQGSGSAGHEIPHGLGQEANLSTIKELDNSSAWIVQRQPDNYLVLNEDYVEQATSYISGMDSTNNTLSANTSVNETDVLYIQYNEANSDNIKIGTYSGTGAAGNEVYLGFKPSRVMVKRVNAVDNWFIYDNARGNDGHELYPDLPNVEFTGGDLVDFTATGFTLTSSNRNQLGSEQLVVAYADTDADGGGSETSLPSSTTSVQATSAILGYSDGYDSTGAVNSQEDISGTIAPTLSEGINYFKKEEGGSWTATLIKPVFGETSSTADYRLSDGVWYNSSDVAYTTPIEYLNKAFEADASGNVSVIHDFNYASLVEDTVNFKNIEGLDKPIFQGYLKSSLTANSLIFAWTAYTDTHNGMNGGIYTVQKEGWYTVRIDIKGIFSNASDTTNVDIFVGDDTNRIDIRNGQVGAIATNHRMGDTFYTYLLRGDTIYAKSVNASSTATIYKDATKLSIEYIGNNFTTGS